MNKEILLEEYYEYFRKEEWGKAQEVIKSLISSSDEKSFWLYTCLR